MTFQPFDVYFNLASGYQPYGNAKVGSGGILPEISGEGFPTTGGTSSLVVEQAVGGAAASVWVGVGPQSKTALAILGGTVLVTPVLAFPLALGGAAGTPGAGGAIVPLELPAIRELIGGNLNWQAFVLDPGATFGIAMTNALEMWIG